MKSAADLIEQCARIVESYKRDASYVDNSIGALEHNSNQANIAAEIRKLKASNYGRLMPVELSDEQSDAALRATASWLDVKGSQLTVNREKMKARYRALVKFVNEQNTPNI